MDELFIEAGERYEAVDTMDVLECPPGQNCRDFFGIHTYAAGRDGITQEVQRGAIKFTFLRLPIQIICLKMFKYQPDMLVMQGLVL